MELIHLLGTDEQQEQWLRAAARRRDPLGVRDDRAGRGQQRRDEHRDPHRARRRRVRHQRPQVVDHRRRRPALQAARRHGQDRPRPPRSTGSSRWCSCRPTPRASRSSGRCRSSATSTSRVTARSSSTTCGCRSANILGEEGGGFAAAQARLGPGRIHHVMRALGAGERALALMVARTKARVGVRQGARRAGRRPRPDRRVADRPRPGPRPLPPRRCRHRRRGQQGGAPPRRRGEGVGAAHGPARSSTARSRSTAAPASPTTPPWPRCTAGTARCGSSTAPTTCTC